MDRKQRRRNSPSECLETRQRVKLFESPEDVEEFFRACDALEGPEREPDWSEHLGVINESRARGLPG